MLRQINKKEITYIILSFLIFSILSILLFLKVKFNTLTMASDTQFHLRRIMELKESIEHNQMLPEFSFNFFHGAPIMSMYPYLSVYPLALLLFIVPSFIKSYYIFIVLTTFLTLLIGFFSSLRYSKSMLISYLFSVVYGLSSTFIFGYFSTGDLGIVTALSVQPLAIFGFLDILYGSNNYLKLSFGLILLLFCQIPSFIIIISFLIFWSIVNFHKFTRSIIINFIKAIILSILITSIIWVPMIHIILTSNIYSVYTKPVLIGANLKYFFESVGWIAPITIIISIFYFKKFNKIDKQMYLFALLICFISTKFMPWIFISYIPIVRLINRFQFAYRFLIISLILLCYLFAKCMKLIIQLHNNKKLLIDLVLIFVVLLQFSSQLFEVHKFTLSQPLMSYQKINNIKNNSKYVLNNNGSVHHLIYGYFPNHDYYPTSAVSAKNQIINNFVKFSKGSKSRLYRIKYNKFDFYNKSLNKTIILPFVYYNNENIRLYINSHYHSFSVTDNNLIEIHNIKPGHEILNIKYIPNKVIELKKYVLFTIGILWICIFIFRRYDIN